MANEVLTSNNGTFRAIKRGGIFDIWRKEQHFLSFVTERDFLCFNEIASLQSTDHLVELTEFIQLLKTKNNQ